MEDLFGEEAELEVLDSNVPKEERHSDKDPSSEDDLFGDGEVHAEGDAPETTDDIHEEIITQFSVANYRTPGNRQDDLYLAKLPSFLDISSTPYDTEALLASIQQAAEDSADNDEKLIKKRSMLNTLRWKLVAKEDGSYEHVSNARFVRWSDGSLSLQVGEELFDVPVKSMTRDHSYLTLMHPDDGILRGMRRFTKSMNFQPYGLSSKSHAELKADIARRSITSKSRTVKVHATLVNPEQMQKDAIKAESERLKARRRLDNQTSRALNHTGRDRTRLTANYLDDSDEEIGGERGRRDGYLDDNDDGFVENDEDEEADVQAGAGRLQALKDEGARRYKNDSTSRASKKRRDDEDEDEEISEDESIVYEDDVGEESEEEEAAMTPKRSLSPPLRDASIPDHNPGTVKKLKRRIVDSDEDE